MRASALAGWRRVAREGVAAAGSLLSQVSQLERKLKIREHDTEHPTPTPPPGDLTIEPSQRERQDAPVRDGQSERETAGVACRLPRRGHPVVYSREGIGWRRCSSACTG
jgi:hypothetical protein